MTEHTQRIIAAAVEAAHVDTTGSIGSNPHRMVLRFRSLHRDDPEFRPARHQADVPERVTTHYGNVPMAGGINPDWPEALVRAADLGCEVHGYRVSRDGADTWVYRGGDVVCRIATSGSVVWADAYLPEAIHV